MAKRRSEPSLFDLPDSKSSAPPPPPGTEAVALHEAAGRGRVTTSLQASKLGQGIYARLGYQPLGEIHLYERRP